MAARSKKRSKLALTLIALVTLLVMSGCPPPPFVTIACEDDDDCPDDRACHEVTAARDTACLAPCSDKSECEEGQRCKSGACRYPRPADAGTDAGS